MSTWLFRVVISLCVVAFPALASPQTLDQQEQQRALEKGLSQLDEATLLFERASKERMRHCIAASANQRYCDCVLSKIPAIVSYLGYVQIVTQTKEELGYAQLSSDDKKVIDATRRGRDTCAALVK
jgi:hypothetical protein